MRCLAPSPGRGLGGTSWVTRSGLNLDVITPHPLPLDLRERGK
jgi:hypothetical protein